MAQHYRDDQYATADSGGNTVHTFKPPNANTAITGTVAVFNSAAAALYTAEIGSATIGLAWGSWYGVSPFQVQMLGEVLIVRGSGNVAGTSYHAVLIGRADPLGQEDFTAPFSSAPVAAGGPASAGVSQIKPGAGIGVAPAGGTGVVTVTNTATPTILTSAISPVIGAQTPAGGAWIDWWGGVAFTCASSSSLILILYTGRVEGSISNVGADICSARAVVDGVARQTEGGDAGGANQYMNALAGGGATYIAALGAGAHSTKLQVQSGSGFTTFVADPGGQINLQVIEFLP